MAQAVAGSEPWPQVGNVRQNWYPMLTTGNRTLLSKLATILHSVREDLQDSDRKSREQPTPELRNSLLHWVMEVWVVQFKQHAGRHSTGNNATLGQSLKKVLHAYDFWPWVLNPGVWETCNFKTGSQRHSYWSEQKGAWWGLHTVSNSFSRWSS